MVFTGLLIGSVEAGSIRPRCVSISDVAGAGQEMGASLSGVKALNGSEKRIVRNPKQTSDDAKSWYDLVRVNRESVLVQIEF